MIPSNLALRVLRNLRGHGQDSVDNGIKEEPCEPDVRMADEDDTRQGGQEDELPSGACLDADFVEVKQHNQVAEFRFQPGCSVILCYYEDPTKSDDDNENDEDTPLVVSQVCHGIVTQVGFSFRDHKQNLHTALHKVQVQEYEMGSRAEEFIIVAREEDLIFKKGSPVWFQSQTGAKEKGVVVGSGQLQMPVQLELLAEKNAPKSSSVVYSIQALGGTIHHGIDSETVSCRPDAMMRLKAEQLLKGQQLHKAEQLHKEDPGACAKKEECAPTDLSIKYLTLSTFKDDALDVLETVTDTRPPTQESGEDTAAIAGIEATGELEIVAESTPSTQEYDDSIGGITATGVGRLALHSSSERGTELSGSICSPPEAVSSAAVLVESSLKQEISDRSRALEGSMSFLSREEEPSSASSIDKDVISEDSLSAKETGGKEASDVPAVLLEEEEEGVWAGKDEDEQEEEETEEEREDGCSETESELEDELEEAEVLSGEENEIIKGEIEEEREDEFFDTESEDELKEAEVLPDEEDEIVEGEMEEEREDECFDTESETEDELDEGGTRPNEENCTVAVMSGKVASVATDNTDDTPLIKTKTTKKKDEIRKNVQDKIMAYFGERLQMHQTYVFKQAVAMVCGVAEGTHSFFYSWQDLEYNKKWIVKFAISKKRVFRLTGAGRDNIPQGVMLHETATSGLHPDSMEPTQSSFPVSTLVLAHEDGSAEECFLPSSPASAGTTRTEVIGQTELHGPSPSAPRSSFDTTNFAGERNNLQRLADTATAADPEGMPTEVHSPPKKSALQRALDCDHDDAITSENHEVEQSSTLNDGTSIAVEGKILSTKEHPSSCKLDPHLPLPRASSTTNAVGPAEQSQSTASNRRASGDTSGGTTAYIPKTVGIHDGTVSALLGYGTHSNKRKSFTGSPSSRLLEPARIPRKRRPSQSPRSMLPSITESPTTYLKTSPSASCSHIFPTAEAGEEPGQKRQRTNAPWPAIVEKYKVMTASANVESASKTSRAVPEGNESLVQGNITPYSSAGSFLPSEERGVVHQKVRLPIGFGYDFLRNAILGEDGSGKTDLCNMYQCSLEFVGREVDKHDATNYDELLAIQLRGKDDSLLLRCVFAIENALVRAVPPSLRGYLLFQMGCLNHQLHGCRRYERKIAFTQNPFLLPEPGDPEQFRHVAFLILNTAPLDRSRDLSFKANVQNRFQSCHIKVVEKHHRFPRIPSHIIIASEIYSDVWYCRREWDCHYHHHYR